MQLEGDRMPFGDRQQRSRPARIAVLLALIVGGVMLTRLVEAGQVEPLFLPTPTATRTAFSYQEEGQAHFSAGDLERAIAAYQQAVSLTPNQPELWANLARIQTYSSALMSTSDQERLRLQEAKAAIDRAVELDEENSYAWAIHILVYDWLAGAANDESERQAYYLTAEQSVSRATNLEGNQGLVQAFDAELAVDQLNYAQAEDKINQAVALPDGDQMDVHRVHGTVLESLGFYEQAIAAYQRALAFAPNFTFLHLRIGANYRRLGDADSAIESFRQAALINSQLGIKDPIPHLAIGRTWLQEGEFITAARNVEAAVSIDPSSAELLGFLGIAYFKARNYENAEDALGCAVLGCDVQTQTWLLCSRLRVLDCTDEQLAEVEAQALQVDAEAAEQLYLELLCRGQGFSEEQCASERFTDLSGGVRGLTLGSTTLEYFYTYGSVLAFAEECSQAEQIFEQLEQGYSDDQIIMEIIEEGRTICPTS